MLLKAADNKDTWKAIKELCGQNSSRAQLNCDPVMLNQKSTLPDSPHDGTYKVLDELLPCLDAALGAGYRGIAPKSYGAAAALSAYQISQEALDTPYLDLYSIHWPGLQGVSAIQMAKDARGYMADLRRQSWQALETLVIESQENADILARPPDPTEVAVIGSGPYRTLRSLGLCNYLPRHMEELAAYSTITPAVLQHEFHPYLSVRGQEHPMRRMCTRLFPLKTVQFQTHTSLASGSQELFNSTLIQQFANETQRTPAQIIIRWAMQKRQSVVAKSTKPRHIVENARVFGWKLDEDILDQIDAMERNERFCWDPNSIP